MRGAGETQHTNLDDWNGGPLMNYALTVPNSHTSSKKKNYIIVESMTAEEIAPRKISEQIYGDKIET